MNKNDLIETIADTAQISKAAAERGLNGMLTMMSMAMEDGERVTLAGFGSFTVVDRAPGQEEIPKQAKWYPFLLVRLLSSDLASICPRNYSKR